MSVVCAQAPQIPSKEASFYQKLIQQKVQCQLCPRRCIIPNGKRGFCGVRENRLGTLYSLSYGKLVSANDYDPIEKKPLFHFYPGTRTFSVATAGCNLSCKFCQNWEISQKKPEEINFQYVSPEELVREVKKSGCPIIAYTYTEPTIFYEYMLDTARLAHEAGLKNVMHSNGYINPEPLKELAKYLDAANIDLKGFSNDYYSRIAGGMLLNVLESLKILKTAKVHLEITTLIVPGYNDDFELIKQMSVWIKDNLGEDTPLHFSRFFPTYKLAMLEPTPPETLQKARQIALDAGLLYVYVGNLAGTDAQNTYCPKCKKMIIHRKGYIVEENQIKNSVCIYCGYAISGVWE